MVMAGFPPDADTRTVCSIRKIACWKAKPLPALRGSAIAAMILVKPKPLSLERINRASPLAFSKGRAANIGTPVCSVTSEPERTEASRWSITSARVTPRLRPPSRPIATTSQLIGLDGRVGTLAGEMTRASESDRFCCSCVCLARARNVLRISRLVCTSCSSSRS